MTKCFYCGKEVQVYFTSEYLPGKNYCYDCLDIAEAEMAGAVLDAGPEDFIEL